MSSVPTDAGRAILVVACRGLLQERCLRSLRERVEVRRAATLEEADAELARNPWTGLILGLHPDGTGLAWLEALRERDPRQPVLAVAGDLGKEVSSACHRVGVRCVFAPIDAQTALLFAARALAQQAERDERIAAVVDRLAVERGLSPREAEIAGLAALGISRAGLASSLGISENSVKACVRGLLRRTDARSVDAVGRAVLAQVVATDTADGADLAGPPSTASRTRSRRGSHP
jgi:DNA-binding NarL/FixJ family response regulator